MLNICMSADHELFSGVNFRDAEYVMINPTTRLMKLLDNQGVPLTLFTDVCSVERYRQLTPEDSFPAKTEEQLRNAIAGGHDVQLHIHPHWYDSKVADGQWSFDLSRFRLHEWGFSPHDSESAQHIIRRGKAYLESLLKPVNSSYQCVGFRAGGWCIQPERPLLEALLDAGIWIDATVFRGGYHDMENRGYDFRNAPDMDSWWVDPAKGLFEPVSPGEGRVFEVSIGSNAGSLSTAFLKAVYRIDRKINKRQPMVFRGTSNDDLSVLPKVLHRRVASMFQKPVLLTYDNACARSMLDIVGRYVRMDQQHNDDSFISIIGHPKTLQTDDYRELDRFCSAVRRTFGDEVRFVTIRDIADIQEKFRKL